MRTNFPPAQLLNHLTLRLIHLFTLLTIVAAFPSWLGIGTAPPVSMEHTAGGYMPDRSAVFPSTSGLQNFGGSITQNELDILMLNSEVFRAYDTKPDCFRDAVANIRGGCERLDAGEDERVRAAISMTLCEIATAQHYSIPYECQEFLGTAEAHIPSPPSRERQRACVDALSRSAQFWSSYSGYLREIAPLCKAYNVLQGVDLAKQIYRNATIEKVQFIRLATEAEKKAVQQLEMFREPLAAIREIVDRLDGLSTKYQALPGLMLDYIESDSQKFVESALLKMADTATREIARSSNQNALVLASLTDSQHKQSLNSILLETRSILKDEVRSIVLEAGSVMEGFSKLQVAYESLCMQLYDDSTVLREATALVLRNMQDVQMSLTTSQELSSSLRESQLDGMAVASELRNALTDLVAVTTDQTAVANATLSYLEDRMPLQGPWLQWRLGIMELVTGGLSHLWDGSGLGIRLVIASCRCIWVLIRALSSAFASGFVALAMLSRRRKEVGGVMGEGWTGNKRRVRRIVIRRPETDEM